MTYYRRTIPDPIRNLTLERLSQQIDAYTNGYPGEFALTAETMEQRDDLLKIVVSKRKKAVTRHGWEILAENDSPDARRQREALDYFYRNLTCTHALRHDLQGGFQLLAHQMMDAIGKGYAVHEIEWQVRKEKPDFGMCEQGRALAGGDAPPLSAPRSRARLSPARTCLTARFQFVPLWYFESATGRLRFLKTPGALAGEDLEPRHWLVTVGDAIMVACSRAFMFKHQPLQAWLDYTQKFGFPGIRGITGAARGTPEFTEMEEALSTFLKQLSVVTGTDESIDVIDLKGGGQPPFPELVERMDRVMAALWRGADLSTLSRDRGYGASLQEAEARLLEQDDARTLSEHLNATVDRWVIDLLFGEAAPQLARLKILVTPQECTPHDLAVDQFLVEHGARLSISETLERYGRAEAEPGEAYLRAKSEGRPPNELHDTAKGEGWNANEKTNRALECANPKRGLPHERSDNEGCRPSTPPAPLSGETRHVARGTKRSRACALPNLYENHNLEPALDFTPARPLDDFIQLSPIGLFPHPRGLQNVDKAALECGGMTPLFPQRDMSRLPRKRSRACALQNLYEHP